MHAPPKPMFHRDIRWPNIIQDAGTLTKWFLIDWDDASASPTHAAMHLNPQSHCPTIFTDNHGAEVDIWAAGRLIIDAAVFVSGILPAVMNLGKKMESREITSAAQALNELRNIR
jgi:hypothetical protein